MSTSRTRVFASSTIFKNPSVCFIRPLQERQKANFKRQKAKVQTRYSRVTVLHFSSLPFASCLLPSARAVDFRFRTLLHHSASRSYCGVCMRDRKSVV